MIAFLTLLLGLISGSVPIEVTTGGPVDRVVLLVDGIPGGTITSPPWRTQVDLGDLLEPHVLTARALDANGVEIARTEQWINLPRPPAEVEVVLEKGPAGTPIAARLTWQSVNGALPGRSFLALDGKLLALDPQGRAPLPKLNLKGLHVLSAEAWFGPGISGHRDVVFGGEYGGEVSTELTAVPVKISRSTAGGLSAARLQGRFQSAGQPLTVAAVEEGPARVLVVNVPGPSRIYKQILATPELLESSKTEMSFDKETEVRLLSPFSKHVTGSGVAADLFDISRDFHARDGGLIWLLAQTALASAPVSVAPRIADTVAVAGLQAAVENRRRAVVLLLGDGAEDGSRYSIEAVRHYLASIRVPLYVWSLYGPTASLAASWGGAEDVSSLRKLYRAFDRLKDDIGAQRIVWIEGRYLPQAINLAAGTAVVDPITRSASPAPRGER